MGFRRKELGFIKYFMSGYAICVRRPRLFFFVMLCVGVYVCMHVCVSLSVCGRMCVSVCSYVSKRGTLSQRQGQPPYNLFQA